MNEVLYGMKDKLKLKWWIKREGKWPGKNVSRILGQWVELQALSDQGDKLEGITINLDTKKRFIGSWKSQRAGRFRRCLDKNCKREKPPSQAYTR